MKENDFGYKIRVMHILLEGNYGGAQSVAFDIDTQKFKQHNGRNRIRKELGIENSAFMLLSIG